jgi:hypothetical protein
MRLTLALAVIVVAFAAAIFIHQRHTTRTTHPRDFSKLNLFAHPARQHPSWEDPVAVVVAVGGVAVAAGIVATERSTRTKVPGRA